MYLIAEGALPGFGTAVPRNLKEAKPKYDHIDHH
jgi:hypothetical protein